MTSVECIKTGKPENKTLRNYTVYVDFSKELEERELEKKRSPLLESEEGLEAILSKLTTDFSGKLKLMEEKLLKNSRTRKEKGISNVLILQQIMKNSTTLENKLL